MNVLVKISDFQNAIRPVVDCSITGVKKEYQDAYKVSFDFQKTGITVRANNGYVASQNRVTEKNNPDMKITGTDEFTATIRSADLMETLNSFSSSKFITMNLNGKMLEFRSDRTAAKEDAETALPIDAQNIEMPVLAGTFDKEMTLKKAALTTAIDKIYFAIGFEKFRPEFLYWVMRVKNGYMRAVCGDGARFACYEIEGDGVLKTKKPFDICISKDHTPVLQKALAWMPDTDLTIKSYNNTGDKDSLMDQIVVSNDDFSMTMIGHDPGVKWPNEDKFLTRDNEYKYVFDSDDIPDAISGMKLTHNEEQRQQTQFPKTQMSISNSVAVLKSETTIKSSRKVRVKDAWAKNGSTDLPFLCNTDYLGQVKQKMEKGDTLQLEFVSDKAPAVIRFFAGDKVSNADLYRVNITNATKEKFTVFFTPISQANR